MVPAFTFAVVFSAGGLSPYLEHGAGSGKGGGVLRALFGRPGGSGGKGADEDPVRRKFYWPGGSPAVVVGDIYASVILWPEVERYTMLVPPLPGLAGSFPNARQPDVTGYPFSGFYSFGRAFEPPANKSYVMHGDPARLGFRTTDRSPLKMEARQHFGRPIATSCCRAIGVAVKVADSRPGTVSLELILRNTTVADRPSQSLGRQPLGVRGEPGAPNPAPAEETVTFRMPPPPRLAEFDEAIVRFRLEPRRWDHSAKAAIRRFVFER